MILLQSAIFNRSDKKIFPFNLQLVKKLKKIEFDSPVTFFVGENGSGKSTILEGIAAVAGSVTVGSDSVDRDNTLACARQFAKNIKLVWNNNTHRGFFLRAEDFFGFTKRLSQMKVGFGEDIKDFERELTGYGKQLAIGAIKSQIFELEKRYGKDLDAMSHGESFLKLFQSRLVPKGLYLLDEPEVPLSPKRQLGLLSIIKDMVAKNCQFIIATHSPILMCLPEASILLFEKNQVKKVPRDEIEHITLTRSFLEAPEQYLKHL